MPRKPFVFGLRSAIPPGQRNSADEVLRQAGANVGNLAFHHAIEKLMDTRMAVLPWSSIPAEITAAGDLLVLPCANQLGPHADMGGQADTFAAVPDTKIVAVGLGAQAGSTASAPKLPEGTVRWLRILNERRQDETPNISARGSFSSAIINDVCGREASLPLGCPSILISSETRLGQILRPKTRHRIRKVAVLAGHHRWPALAPIEQFLVRLCRDTDGFYILQSDETLFQIHFSQAPPEQDENWRTIQAYCAPNWALNDFVTWFRRTSRVFYDVPSWIEACRSCNLAVGARIHGVVLALQAGVPSVCLVHDSRTEELCETLAVPWLDMRQKKTLTLDEITQCAQAHDWERFDAVRQRAAIGYHKFFTTNGLPASRHLNALAAVQEPSCV